MRIQSTANRNVLRSRLKNLGHLIAGKKPIPSDAGEEIRAILLYHLVRIIYREFLKKSSGKTDRYGEKWDDIKPETKAYNKPSLRKALDLPGPKYRPTLSPEQDAAWRHMFKKVLGWIDYNYLISRGGEVRTATQDEKSKAAISGWEAAKQAGAVTLIELLGNKKVPLLIETGALKRALRPGTRTGRTYTSIDKNQVPYHRGFAFGVDITLPYFNAVNAKRRVIPRKSNRKKLLQDVWEEAKPEIQAVIAKYLKK